MFGPKFHFEFKDSIHDISFPPWISCFTR